MYITAFFALLCFAWLISEDEKGKRSWVSAFILLALVALAAAVIKFAFWIVGGLSETF